MIVPGVTAFSTRERTSFLTVGSSKTASSTKCTSATASSMESAGWNFCFSTSVLPCANRPCASKSSDSFSRRS